MILRDWFHELSNLVTRQHIFNLLTAISFLLVGFFLARRARSAVGRAKKIELQQRMLFEKMAYYGIVILSIAASLDTLGFDLRVLLGAAGVLTVAIGFAAQTSASNLISGIFLMIERPFVVGNTISVGDIRGEVMAIDLLSTKIRTFTNLMVRIPNETLVKSNIVNFSFFPIRRLDLEVGVNYASDLAHVESLIRETINGHPLALRSPLPEVNMKGFGSSSIDFEIHVWTQTESAVNVKSEIYRALNNAFVANGIDIPFPTQTTVLVNPQAQQR
jgi:small-conductance mechanosensitive channel